MRFSVGKAPALSVSTQIAAREIPRSDLWQLFAREILIESKTDRACSAFWQDRQIKGVGVRPLHRKQAYVADIRIRNFADFDVGFLPHQIDRGA